MHPRVLLSPRGSARPPPQHYALADEHEQPLYEQQPHAPQRTGSNGRHPRWLANE